MSASLRRPATTENAWIPVNLKTVGSTQSAASEITRLAVNVDQVTRGTHMRGAGSMSACQTLNVLTLLPVEMRSVLTLAIAQLTQTAKLATIEVFAPVEKDTQEIHTLMAVD